SRIHRVNLPDRERWHVISMIRLIPWRMINIVECFADDGDHRLFPSVNVLFVVSEKGKSCESSRSFAVERTPYPARRDLSTNRSRTATASVLQHKVNVAVSFNFKINDTTFYCVPLVLRSNSPRLPR